jgi:hypothetical protein
LTLAASLQWGRASSTQARACCLSLPQHHIVRALTQPSTIGLPARFVHEAALVRYLTRVWPSRSEIHDLRQEAYVRVYEAAKESRLHAPKSSCSRPAAPHGRSHASRPNRFAGSSRGFGSLKRPGELPCARLCRARHHTVWPLLHEPHLELLLRNQSHGHAGRMPNIVEIFADRAIRREFAGACCIQDRHARPMLGIRIGCID